ncbi:hypothetical protein THAOC_14637 [Thalassiosira oceanica]|uniref:Uncharacterized protein n=1 Tax=Thalassiosira oceanica TaxID=159749 RepID=K0SES5_THAOC|nr:hypothetical protein THAOC_14637 [Thalassiosira oceanica]|eukprot:EJK64613.1 hypothetical protein THAOC_14637 [Thalassiosira oceanica]
MAKAGVAIAAGIAAMAAFFMSKPDSTTLWATKRKRRLLTLGGLVGRKGQRAGDEGEEGNELEGLHGFGDML